MALDVYQLFIALFAAAILQEFAIKPSVEMIRKYYKKLHEHMKNNL